jgi:hypothetical protein
MRADERTALGRRHLTDDQLMEIYVLAGENAHLSACRRCRGRFDEMVRAFEQMRDTALHEADAVFTGERLHDQRDRIMRRIERHDHPAHVVMFPARPAVHPAVQRVLGPARRWVAAAAAAGVAAGMFLGFAMDRSTHYASLDRPVARQSVAATAPPAWQATDARDDQFFTEIEDALMGSRSVELRAIDTMTTPVEIREVSYPR